VSKAYAGKSLVVIDLDNQNRELMCDIDGHVKPGQLPMTMVAELYRGTVKIEGFVGMTYYPVSDGDDVIDPMLDTPWPVEPAVSWSLLNAPPGVTVNEWEGVITIAENAGLSVSNDITVQAVWRGETFTALLHLGKVFDGQRGEKGDEGEQGSPAPRYRGKTVTPGGATGLVTIQINANATQTVRMSPGDWVAYVGENSGIWIKGMCMRWNGVSWEAIPVSADGNFETNPYVAALMDLTEGAPAGTFMSVLVRDLIAKTAMIEYIASHKIHIQTKDGNSGAIYGGGYDENGNPTGGPGFYLGTDGKLKALNGEFSGTVNADSGSFKNATIQDVLITGNSIFEGDIRSGPLVLSNEITNPTIYTINSGTSLWDIMKSPGMVNSTGTHTVMVYNASYDGKSVVMVTITFWGSEGNAVFVYSDGSSETVAMVRNYNDTKNLGHTFRYALGTGGKTFRLHNLPTAGNATGDVYRNGNYLMIM
jgi:hypothetical protein